MFVVFIGIALGIFLIDSLLKYSIEERLLKNEERPVLGGKVLIRRVHNKGVCLNLFQTYPDKVMKVSVLLGILTILSDVVLLFKKGNFRKKLGMMIFTGGALSNIYDRIMRGYVVDYIGFKSRWAKLTRITYNLGDFAIFIGTVLISIAEIFPRKKKH